MKRRKIKDQHNHFCHQSPEWNIFFTPRVSDGCNSFGIVCECVSVCLSVSLSWPNRLTYRLEFWHVGQVNGYLGQDRRS